MFDIKNIESFYVLTFLTLAFVFSKWHDMILCARQTLLQRFLFSNSEYRIIGIKMCSSHSPVKEFITLWLNGRLVFVF